MFIACTTKKSKYRYQKGFPTFAMYKMINSDKTIPYKIKWNYPRWVFVEHRNLNSDTYLNSIITRWHIWVQNAIINTSKTIVNYAFTSSNLLNLMLKLDVVIWICWYTQFFILLIFAGIVGMWWCCCYRGIL